MTEKRYWQNQARVMVQNLFKLQFMLQKAYFTVFVGGIFLNSIYVY